MRKPYRWMLTPWLAVAIMVMQAPATSASAQELRTPAEESDFARHTNHQDMVTYLQALQATSTDMKLAVYGTSRQGRELIYAIFSRSGISQPWEALLTDKPIVLLAANVHGGERTYREALLIIMRELAEEGTPANRMLDDLIVLVAPSLNPDGLEARSRGNSWGQDLNRDYIKLEQPEVAHFVGDLLNVWHPHLYIDGHNGGPFPYNLTYHCPHASAHYQRLTEICDYQLFPAIDAKLETAGYLSWYYSRGNETRWTVPGPGPRMGHNYGGLTNKISILFEAPGARNQTFEAGIRAGELGFAAVLEFMQERGREVRAAVDSARRETVRLGRAAEGDVVIRQRFEPADRLVDYKISRGTGDEREVVQVTGAQLMSKAVPTHVRPRPYAYILPRDAVDAVALLRRHNIAVEVLQQRVELEVDAYTLADIRYRSQFNHAATTNVRVGEVVTLTRRFPAGTYVVPTGQILGRVVTEMLEPETADNVIVWNTMDAWLPKGQLEQATRGRAGNSGDVAGAPAGAGSQGLQAQDPPIIPIFKVMRPTAMPTRVLKD